MVAVLAYNIDAELRARQNLIQQEIARQEVHRAAVSRSVALYRYFTESDAVQTLRNVANRIHHRLWQKGPDNIKENAIAIFGEKKFKELSSEIRGGLIEVLQNVKVIYRCGKFEDLYEKNKRPTKNPLCDQETIFVLLGALLAELQSTFRPVIYCDDFFKQRYLARDEVAGHISMFENLVQDYIVKDFRNKGVVWRVYLTEEKRRKAIEDKSLKKGDSNWSILRTPHERCKFYSS